jgi:hypothetical protein
MADLSLSPAPSAAAPAAAPAPAASRPAAEPLKPEAADPDEDKDETETPTRAAPAAPKVTVAGAASSSEGLGGLIPDFFSDGTDEASSAISTGRAPQSQPALSKAGAVPTDTGLPSAKGDTDAADNCPSSDTSLSCKWGLSQTVGVSVGGIRKSSSTILSFH